MKTKQNNTCELSISAWQRLMQMWKFPDNQTTFEQLQRAYQEPQRHYHNAAHINALLAHKKSVVHMLDQPREVLMAVWFHDAIYRPYAGNNELRSAQWCDRFLLQHDIDNDTSQRVHELIMATLHPAVIKTQDQAFLVDMDLSILGAEATLYAKYEQWIRQEYRWVPGWLYRHKRKALLQSFNEQSNIYQTPYFQQRYEQQAKQNLAWAMSRL